MAKKTKKINGVWGIDIGQCALKAMRCRLDDDGESVITDGYDFIEYPKILSQPEADPVELVREALEQFLSRNDLKGDRVAISVPGQSGLTRFFKPPPVDVKLIPNIVKYEARQQIPFSLDEVIWDFQQIGGTEVDGFALDAEIGLFAMKREQVFRAIQPFMEAEVELHLVQLAPLSVYNFVGYELLADAPPPEEVDPDNPPESLIVLAMGTETTDLVITDGTRIWQRSIPLGGNHFTKQLTKEMKLTFAKAEHLKRNARQSEDPKAIFQGMRSVFGDLVNEVQRSLGYFRSIDRQAKLDRMVILGNAVKLPGLKQYLSKSLGHEVVEIESFARLSGKSVVAAPTFKENLLSFPVCYGLCLQGLNRAKLTTNLLPPEFVTARMIREKKPWTVAAVGVLVLGLAIHYFFSYAAWWKVHPERATNDVTWTDVESEIENISSTSGQFIDEDNKLLSRRDQLTALGEEVVGTRHRRVAWLKLMTAITSALPQDEEPDPAAEAPADRFLDRREMRILRIESQYFPDLTLWFNEAVRKKYLEEQLRLGDSAAEGDEEADQADVDGPTGPGWVIEITGYHFHNSGPNIEDGWGAAYVRNTLLKNLRRGKVMLPGNPGSPPEEFSMAELGIVFPILAEESRIDKNNVIENPDYVRPIESDATVEAPPEDPTNVPVFPAPKQYFTVQFCWQEEIMIEHLKEREQRQQQPPPAADESDVAVSDNGGS